MNKVPALPKNPNEQPSLFAVIGAGKWVPTKGEDTRHYGYELPDECLVIRPTKTRQWLLAAFVDEFDPKQFKVVALWCGDYSIEENAPEYHWSMDNGQQIL